MMFGSGAHLTPVAAISRGCSAAPHVLRLPPDPNWLDARPIGVCPAVRFIVPTALDFWTRHAVANNLAVKQQGRGRYDLQKKQHWALSPHVSSFGNVGDIFRVTA